MNSEILILTEQRDGKLDSRTQDLIAWTKPLAQKKRWKVSALLLGSNLEQAVSELSGSGIDTVFVLDDPRFESYTPASYLDAMEQILKQAKPQVIIADHSYFGIEIAGALASILNVPCISNCQSIETTNDGFLITRAMFGGRFLATLAVGEADPLVITVSKAASITKNERAGDCEVVTLSYANAAETRITVLDESKPSYGDDISQADVIVSVGRAIRQPEQIESFRELAHALGGVLAASRPLVDAGWLSPAHQVGLSGVTVKPKVYLALGISGSAQHLAGMNQSKLIIAINSDPSAPIFQVAHCGAVADIFEILPLLLEKVQRTKNVSGNTQTITQTNAWK